jgi:hypothetical protein
MNEHARDQLLLKGEVVTFRQHKRKRNGRDWVTDKRGGNKICDIYVTYLCEVKKIEDLTPYVSLSGFNNLWDWVSGIRKFSKGSPEETIFKLVITIQDCCMHSLLGDSNL